MNKKKLKRKLKEAEALIEGADEMLDLNNKQAEIIERQAVMLAQASAQACAQENLHASTSDRLLEMVSERGRLQTCISGLAIKLREHGQEVPIEVMELLGLDPECATCGSYAALPCVVEGKLAWRCVDGCADPIDLEKIR